MKNLNIISTKLLLILISSGIIISCSNQSSMIVGKWMYEKYEFYKNNQLQYTQYCIDCYYLFQANGTGIYSYFNTQNQTNQIPITYNVFDDSLNINYGNNINVNYYIEELNSNKLIISITDTSYNSSPVSVKKSIYYFNREE